MTNDTDADGDPLTAQLVPDEFLHPGILTFNADGSFTYTADPNFHGADSFTYRAFDGTTYSEPATIIINIHQTPTPPTTPTPPPPTPH